MEWGESSSPSGLACFASNSSFAWTFLLTQFRQNMKCELSFTILHLGKPNFSVVHQSDCGVFILVLKPTISTYFGTVDFDSVLHMSTMRLLYTMPMARANAVEMMQRSFTHLGYHYDICWCWRAPWNWRRKSRLRAKQEKSRLHARISFLLVSETSICVNAYIVKITISTYVIRLDCLMHNWI